MLNRQIGKIPQWINGSGWLRKESVVEKGKFGRISGEELSLQRGNSGKILLWKGMTDKPK